MLNPLLHPYKAPQYHIVTAHLCTPVLTRRNCFTTWAGSVGNSSAANVRSES